MLASLAFLTLVALGEAGKLPQKHSPPFAILVNNTLVPDEVQSANSYLLIRNLYRGTEAPSACRQLGEFIAPSDESEDVASLLSMHNSRATADETQDAWMQGNNSDCVVFSSGTTRTQNCGDFYPVFCTNTAPYQSRAAQPSKNARLTIDIPPGSRIPYAQPPVGERRFKAPEKLGNLLDGNSAAYDATYYRSICPQDLSNNPPPFSKEPMSEDCLYLNVFTLSIPGGKPNALLPVIFWVHGGSYYYGGTSFPYYQGMNLASRENAVVVTIEYRLGALGLFSNPTRFDTSEWTRDYIQSYGGDPDQITVIGESAGGTTIMSFLQMNATKDMLARAVVESGNTLSGWQHPDINNELADLFTDISGCSDLDCLKYNRSAEQLVQYQKKLFAKAQEIYPAGKVNFLEPLRPFIDDDLVTEDWDAALLNGRFNKVPTLLTYNHDEFGLFLQENKTFENTPVNFSSAEAGGPYRSLENRSNVHTAIVDFTTDYTYRCNGEIYAGYLESQNPDVWELTWEMNVAQFMNGSLCSAPEGCICHATEVPLFMGSAAYDDLSYDLLSSINYWQRERDSMDLYGNFARTGILQFNGTVYPRRGNETHNVLHWNDNPEIIPGGVNWGNCMKMQEMGLYDRLYWPWAAN